MTTALLDAGAALAVLASRILRARHKRDHEQHAEGEENTYGLPDGDDIAAELRKWYREQRQAVLEAIPDDRLPDAFPDLDADDWNDPMAAAMTPKLATYWSASGKAVYSRLGMDPDEWRVVNPHLAAQIQQQAFNFCQSTNQTTTKRLDVALGQLRDQFTAGLVTEGETLRQLKRRVKDVFESMSDAKAAQIAATEASRATHAAELTADRESEVVAGLELLLSGDACPLCRKIATECKRVKLGDSFAIIGDNPHYKDIKHPPLHPACQCTIIQILKPEYGGPVAPQWGTPLIQPQKGLADGYKPPAGKTEPKPEPEKKENPPKPTKPPPAKQKPLPIPPPAAPPDIVVVPAKPKREPPVDPAITLARAKAMAAQHGVKLDTHGQAVLEYYNGKRAERIPAAYRPFDSLATIEGVHPPGKTIYANQGNAYWREPGNFMSHYGKKGWFSTTDPDHLIHHEIAHALHHQNIGDDAMKTFVGRGFGEKQKKLIRKHVSGYAATQPAEFVAEVYAGRKLGKQFPENVMKTYNELGGPPIS